MQKTIVHITETLARGGAETLLAGVVKALPDYQHLIVTLKPRNDFEAELQGIRIVQFHLKGYRSIPGLVRQVRQLFQTLNGAVLVHAHMFWANVVSRLAVPKHLPLINSYHSVSYGPHGANYPLHAVLLDRFTYNKRITTLCVSEEVRRNVARYIGIKSNVFVLYNYIADAFYQQSRPAPPSGKLKIVAVGNLKKQKNYETVVAAFGLLKARAAGSACQLDIFGQGPLLQKLQQQVKAAGIETITFKGSVSDIARRLPSYDLYLLASDYEGFGIAVIEAMAVGLPLLLSDIEVLREITEGHAVFFDPHKPEDLAGKLEQILSGAVNLNGLAIQGKAKAEAYRKEAYIKQLRRIYESVSAAV